MFAALFVPFLLILPTLAAGADLSNRGPQPCSQLSGSCPSLGSTCDCRDELYNRSCCNDVSKYYRGDTGCCTFYCSGERWRCSETCACSDYVPHGSCPGSGNRCGCQGTYSAGHCRYVNQCTSFACVGSRWMCTAPTGR